MENFVNVAFLRQKNFLGGGSGTLAFEAVTTESSVSLCITSAALQILGNIRRAREANNHRSQTITDSYTKSLYTPNALKTQNFCASAEDRKSPDQAQITREGFDLARSIINGTAALSSSFPLPPRLHPPPHHTKPPIITAHPEQPDMLVQAGAEGERLLVSGSVGKGL